MKILKRDYAKERRAKKRAKKDADRKWYAVNLSKRPECEVCGKPAIQIHHFYPKGLYGHLRLHEMNGISLCMYHHFRHHHLGDPVIHQTIITRRGKKWYNYLTKLAYERK